MIDAKLTTLLTLIEAQSYTKAAQMLSLTQPAVSQHIRGLEQEYGIKIFLKGTKGMVLTPEGKILEKYARLEKALYSNLLNDFEAYRNGVNRFVIGITPSAEENIVPRVIATYCNQYPDTKITILTDTIQNITNKLKAYEVDIAIVEGHIPDKGLSSILLDTDYLCLIVSPDHPFADRKDVSLEEVKKERLIVRPRGAGTRHMFETYLEGCGESLQNFHVILEIDSVSTIKDLVQSNLGVSVIAHSTCISEERSGRLKSSISRHSAKSIWYVGKISVRNNCWMSFVISIALVCKKQVKFPPKKTFFPNVFFCFINNFILSLNNY